MAKQIYRQLKFKVFDVHTRLIIYRFYVRRFVRHLKHFGLPAALALIGKETF